MRHLIILLTALMLAGPGSAGELLKDLPTSAPEHTLIEINGEEGTSWAWIIKRLPDGFRPKVRMIDSGRTCLWTGPPGVYDIDVIALQDDVLVHDFVRFTIDTVRPKPDPDPDPDKPDPPGPEPSDLTKQVTGWARQVKDPTGAQALALVYHQIADATAAGLMTTDAAIASLRDASDVVLVALGSQKKWEAFRGQISTILTDARQRGQVDTPKDLSNWLKQVALGIEISTDGVESITWPVVIQILTLVNHEIDKVKN